MSVKLKRNPICCSAPHYVPKCLQRRDGARDVSVVRAFVAFVENSGLVPSTHMVAHNYQWLQFQRI